MRHTARHLALNLEAAGPERLRHCDGHVTAGKKQAGRLRVLTAARNEADAAAMQELQRLIDVPRLSNAGREGRL